MGGAERTVVEQTLLHVIEAAERVEVVALVVIERRLFPQTPVDGVGVDIDVVVVGVIGQVLWRRGCHVPPFRTWWGSDGANGPAAVNRQGHPGDEVRRRRDQPEGDPGDLLRRRLPTEEGFRPHRREHLFPGFG